MDFWRTYDSDIRARNGRTSCPRELFEGNPATLAANSAKGRLAGYFDFPLHYASRR